MNNVSFTGMLVLSGTYENLIKAREANNLPEMDTFMSAVLPITKKTKIDHLMYQDRFLYGEQNVEKKLNDPQKRKYFYGGKACRNLGLEYIKDKSDDPIKDTIKYVVYTDKDAEDLYKKCFNMKDFEVPEELIGITNEQAKEMGVYKNPKYKSFLEKFNDCKKFFRNSIRYSLPQISKEYWNTCINRHKNTDGEPCISEDGFPLWDISECGVDTIDVDDSDAFIDYSIKKNDEAKWTAEINENKNLRSKRKKKVRSQNEGWQSKIEPKL